MRGGAEVAHLAHNQEVGGSNPSPATSFTKGDFEWTDMRSVAAAIIGNASRTKKVRG